MDGESADSLYKKKLDDYIEETLKKGFSLEEIEEKLYQSAERKDLAKEVIENRKKTKKKNKWVLWLSIALIACILIITIVCYFNMARLEKNFAKLAPLTLANTT